MSVQFLVVNLERSLEFYTEKLGFEIDFLHEDFYAGVVKDGWSIHLKLGASSREERNNKRNNGDLDIVFSVDDIEALYEELSNKPVVIIQPLRQAPYGKEFYIIDPDGYIIAFLSQP